MDINKIFTIPFLMILIGVFIYQMICIYRIEIHEKVSNSIRFTYLTIATSFLVLGFYFGTNSIHYLTTIILSLMFLAAPFTTGLSNKKIIFEPNLTGLSKMVPKTKMYSDISDFYIKKEENMLNINITFKNKRRVKMIFNTDAEKKHKE